MSPKNQHKDVQITLYLLVMMRTLWAILQCLHSDKVGLLNSNLPPFKQRFKEQVVIGVHNNT